MSFFDKPGTGCMYTSCGTNDAVSWVMAVNGAPEMATDNRHRNNLFTAFLRAPDNGLVSVSIISQDTLQIYNPFKVVL
jgi:hypothetical protein